MQFLCATVPSRVWSRGDDKCHLYVGGFKSSLNIKFLKDHSIGLIVNAAYLLDRLYPPSTKIYQEFEKRRNSKDLEHIEELFVQIKEIISEDEFSSSSFTNTSDEEVIHFV